MKFTGKHYNALTGSELRETVLNEVGRALDNAGLNSSSITYPNTTWCWSLDIFQPMADTEKRTIKTGFPDSDPAVLAKDGELIKALGGGSKRFKHQPPSPTEVRETENLPIPEA